MASMCSGAPREVAPEAGEWWGAVDNVGIVDNCGERRRLLGGVDNGGGSGGEEIPGVGN